MLERRPTFLEPEYPFEWTGVYWLETGRYELSLDEGPDPNMSLVAVANQATDDESLSNGAEWCVRRYTESAEELLIAQYQQINMSICNCHRQAESRFFLKSIHR